MKWLFSALGKQVRTLCTNIDSRNFSKFEKYNYPIIKNENSKTIELKNDLLKSYDARTVNGIYDYNESSGNFIVNADKNVLLDVFCNIAAVPIGYNNPKLIERFNTKNYLPLLLHRNALGVMPPIEWNELINNIMNKMAPIGLDYIHAGCGCGTGANENAIKAAFLYKYYKDNDLNDDLLLEHHTESCMKNLPPGAPEYEMISFDKAFHGRSLGCLSVSYSKPIHKVGIPAFKWNKVDFPNIQYDSSSKTAILNNIEEEFVLNKVYEKLQKNDKIAGLIVEPIQSEGGDNHASNSFFKEIQNICKEFDIKFIVDEVQTGMGATGKFWAHEHWNLDTPPDIVTFAKKAQTSGFFAKKELMPPYPYQIFNTWMGDATRTMILNEILDIINEDNLIDNVSSTGNYLYRNLKILQNNNKIFNLRGKNKGTYIAFDLFIPSEDENRRIEIVNKFKNDMKENGVIIGTCGSKESIRLRPSLIFEKHHANIFLEKMEKILK